MPAARKSPGDVTGRSSALLTEQHQKELAARAGEISVLNAIAADHADDVIEIVPVDLTPKPEPGTEEVEIDVPEEVVEVRVVENIDMMTWGAGKHFDFEAGRRYKMPLSMANHLAERGYIWGM